MRFYQWVKRCRVVNLLQNNSHLKDAINSCRTPVHTELFFFIIRRQVYFLLFFSLIIPSGFHECNIATKLSKNKVSKDWFPLIPNLLHDLKQWIPDIKEFGVGGKKGLLQKLQFVSDFAIYDKKLSQKYKDLLSTKNVLRSLSKSNLVNAHVHLTFWAGQNIAKNA